MTFQGFIGRVTASGMSTRVQCLEWTIPDFSSLSAIGGDRYESPLFKACDGEWFFQIYPHGINQESERWVELVLFRCCGHPPQTFQVTVGVKTAKGPENKKEIRKEFLADDVACCWYRFCSRYRLGEQRLRCMPGDALTLVCDLKWVVPSVAKNSSTQTVEEGIERREHQSLEKRGVEELAESFRGLLSGGEDSDVLLKVRGKEFPAHRTILLARSTVFKAMFTHDMVENQSGVVKMEDCDPESFPAFLEHVYTGSTRMISSGNVFSLYDASDKYDLRVLRKACTTFLETNLTVSCVCDTIALAVQHDEKELIECVTEFFCRNALEIFHTVEWQNFLKENSTIGNELIIKAFSK